MLHSAKGEGPDKDELTIEECVDLVNCCKRAHQRNLDHLQKVRAAEGDRQIQSRVLQQEALSCVERFDTIYRERPFLAKARRSSSTINKSDNVSVEIVKQLAIAQSFIDGSSGPGGDLRVIAQSQMSQSGSRGPHTFLQYMLGSEFHCVQPSSESRLRLKEEYYRFRDRSTILFMLFPACIQLVKRVYPATSQVYSVLFQLHEAWLLYFYMALALRENVLVANGSNIRRWWIRHHYFAIALVLVQLTSPFPVWRIRFTDNVHWWAMMQALIMLLQNRFQRRRLYTAIALGKAKVLDVVAGETSAYAGMMWLLYPVLYLLQMWQIHTGLALAVHCWSATSAKNTIDWQAFAACTLWLSMAFGNTWTTSLTLWHKIRKGKGKSSLKKEE